MTRNPFPAVMPSHGYPRDSDRERVAGACIQLPMPLQTKPEDQPAAVRFTIEPKDGFIEVACAALAQKEEWRYRVNDGAVHFADRDAFKARVVQVGMTPAVAEDAGRSFNATARQLREMGFSVELPQQEEEEKQQAA